jgi:hypothetical protein
MSDPTKDPNFSAVKQPAFDTLVRGHGQTGPALDRMAYQLWLELSRMGVDVSPSVRIRRLAALINSEAADLRRRQTFVKNMDKPGGSPVVHTPKGDYWKMPVGRPGGEPDLSFELNDAEGLPLPNVDPGGTRFSAAQDAVLSWLELHRDAIVKEARARGIPPEAIAATIAWEAIENNTLKHKFQWPIPPGTIVNIPGRGLTNIGRQGTGPGKFHVDGELAKQLERLGYVPRLTEAERDKVLSTPEGAAKYIAASMRAFADLTDQYRKSHPEKGLPSIRDDVQMLTQLYHGDDLDTWLKKLEAKPAPRRAPGSPPEQGFVPGNDMPLWVRDNPEFMAAVRQALAETGPPPQPVEPWIPPGTSPTPPGISPPPSAPAPAPGQSPAPRP